MKDHEGTKNRYFCDPGALELRWISEADATERMSELEDLFATAAEVPWTRNHILVPLPGKWSLSVVGLKNDRVVGASFNSLRDREIYIHAFLVSPEMRGTGVADYLMNELAQKAETCGLSALALRVHQTNSRALRFYSKFGFEVAHTEDEQSQLVMRFKI